MPTSSSFRWAAAPLCALTLLGAAGCGESESDKFASKANDTCRDAEKKIRAASGKPDALIAAGNKLISDLRAIEPPADKKATYDRWLATQQSFFAELETAVRAGDSKRIDALDEHAGDKLAEELGIDACKG